VSATAPLDTLCSIQSGGTPRRDTPEFWGGDVPWVTITDMRSGVINATEEHITSAGLRGSSAKIFPRGTLLLSIFATIGRTALLNIDAATNQAIAGLTIKDASRVDGSYLRRYLDFVAPSLASQARGVAQANINLSILRSTKVPLLPLDEQRRIAAMLDKADVLRAKRREAISKLERLLNSLFLDMFGDPRSNPKHWPVRRIDEVTECLDRLRRPVTAKDRRPGTVPYYGANGQQGWIDEALFDEPLVLVAEDGGHFDRPERGVAYRIDGPSWVNNHAHILRAKNEALEPEYLHRALKHYDFVPFISGTTRAKLTQGQLNGAPILLPPVELQRTFARRVERIVELRRAGERWDSCADGLFDSLQQRAFGGAL
jgi:type I restriction enzyme, S subunit